MTDPLVLDPRPEVPMRPHEAKPAIVFPTQTELTVSILIQNCSRYLSKPATRHIALVELAAVISKMQKKPFPDPKQHIPASSLADYLEEEVPAEDEKGSDLIRMDLAPPVHSRNQESTTNDFVYDEDIPFAISPGSTYRMSPEPPQPIFPGEEEMEEMLRKAMEEENAKTDSPRKNKEGKGPSEQLMRNSSKWGPGSDPADFEGKNGTGKGQFLSPGKLNGKAKGTGEKDGRNAQKTGSGRGENQFLIEESDIESIEEEDADPQTKGKPKKLLDPSSLSQSQDSSSNLLGQSSSSLSVSKTELNPGQKADSISSVTRPKYQLTVSGETQLTSIKSERIIDPLAKEVRDKGNPLIQSQSMMFSGFEEESGKRDRIDQVFPEYEEHKRRKKAKKHPKKLKPIVKKPQLPPLALNGPGDIAGAYGIMQKKPAKKQSLPPLTQKGAN